MTTIRKGASACCESHVPRIPRKVPRPLPSRVVWASGRSQHTIEKCDFRGRRKKRIPKAGWFFGGHYDLLEFVLGLHFTTFWVAPKTVRAAEGVKFWRFFLIKQRHVFSCFFIEIPKAVNFLEKHQNDIQRRVSRAVFSPSPKVHCDEATWNQMGVQRNFKKLS